MLTLTPTQHGILRAIGANGGMTRSDLVTTSGLSKAAISGISRELIEMGIVHETTAVYGQGRPSVLLDFAPDGAYFLGISMLNTPAIIALCDLKGNIVDQICVPISKDPDTFTSIVAQAIPQIIGKNPNAAANIKGIGVAIAGLVNKEQNTCIKSTHLGWQGVPLASMIAEKTGIPTFIENDAKALAVSAKLFGEARDLTTFTVISLSDGIGSAHFIRGNLHRGSHGGAGEIAHATIEQNGLPCRCGKNGCLDTISSINAILQTARSSGIEVDSLNALEQVAASGDTQAISIIHRAGNALGIAISHIIQINDPQMVLLYHQEKSFSGLFATVIQQSIERNVLPRLSGLTPIHSQKLSDEMWAVGAASIVAHKFLFGSN